MFLFEQKTFLHQTTMLFYGTQIFIMIIKVLSPPGADNLFNPGFTLHLSKFDYS
jgi:hypothetical protein